MPTDDTRSVERIASKNTVVQLARHRSAMNSRVGEERAEYGAKVEKAVKESHLDKLAFDFCARLAKMDGGKAARHFRNVMIYGEHLGIGDQADLEDEIDREDEEETKAAKKADTVKTVVAGAKTSKIKQPPKGKPKKAADAFEAPSGVKPKTAASTLHPDKALQKFREVISLAGTETAIQVELQRFVNAHPDLAAQAESAAGERSLIIANPKTAAAQKARGPASEMASEFGYKH